MEMAHPVNASQELPVYVLFVVLVVVVSVVYDVVLGRYDAAAACL